LLVRYAFQNGIYTIVKGVRSIEDFNFEELCHEVGRSQGFSVETVLMLSDPAYVGVSSSNVKILQQDHGDIHTYVPLFVKQKLEQRLSNQYLLGVTGEIGSGKSYFGEKFVEWGRRKGISIHNIELDVLGHRILEGNKEYSHVRAQIIEEFGPNVDRVSLREKVFSSSEKLKKLEELLHKPILACFQEELYGKEGLVLINAALLSEAGLPYLSNNNCVLVRSYKNTRNDRLNQRGLRPKEIERIEHSQYSADVKEKVLKEQIEKDRYGKLWVVKNYDGSDHKKTFEEIAKYFNLLEDRK
jgi:pantetheine-phosphate adenylyltransferase